MSPIVITWVDAFADFDQIPAEDAAKASPKDYLVHTSGFLIHEDEAFVFVAHEILEGGDVRGRTVIPKPLIQKRS